MAAFFVFLTPLAASAQEEFVEWARAPLGKLPPIAAYNFTFYDKKDARGQDTSMEMYLHEAAGLIPVMNRADQDLAVAAMFSDRYTKTGAVMPRDGAKIPESLYNFKTGPFFRKQLDNDWLTGAAFLVGSSTNKLFNSWDEVTLRGDAFVAIPARKDDAWLLYLDYNNNRYYWRGYPVPGAGYWYKPSEKLEAIIGLPVFYVNIKPFQKTDIKFSYIAIDYVYARASYEVTPSLKVFGMFVWDNDVYARADRSTGDYRLVYYEKEVSAGIHWQFMKYAGLKISGGYAFDRFFYEDRRYDKRKENEVKFKDGPFVEAHIGIPF
jgi:hypothetical protein